jgi:hypothetical protein
MSTLSFQEKCLYAELIGTVTFVGVLLAFAARASSTLYAYPRALIAYAVIYFGYSFVVNRRSRFKSGDYLIDERDWMIESKGIRASHNILVIGVVYLIIRIVDAPTLSATRIFNRLLVILVLSSVARIVQMLRLYRASV